MKKKIIAIIILMLATTGILSGCTHQLETATKSFKNVQIDHVEGDNPYTVYFIDGSKINDVKDTNILHIANHVPISIIFYQYQSGLNWYWKIRSIEYL